MKQSTIKRYELQRDQRNKSCQLLIWVQKANFLIKPSEMLEKKALEGIAAYKYKA